MSEIMYKIQSNDDQHFLISESASKHSETLRLCIINLGYSAENAAAMEPIPLQNVAGNTLRRVIDYLEHHKAEPVATQRNRPADQIVIGEWDNQYLDSFSKQGMFDLICAANFLDIQSLLEVACKKVAQWIKGNCPEEMRKEWDAEMAAEKSEEEV